MASNFLSVPPDVYDAFMGRWSRRLATPFLDFAGLEAGERVLDVGCGTGSLTMALRHRADVAAIEAIDFDPGFVAALLSRIDDSRIAARQGDACALPFADAGFDRALALLVFHFVPDAGRAVAELRRVTRPGGIAAAAVWDEFGGMPMQRVFWDTMAAIAPETAERRAGFAFRPTTQPGQLRALFEQAGFAEVVETMLTIRMDFTDAEDYLRPMLGPRGLMRRQIDDLPPETQARIETAVRAGYLCNRPDGPRSFAATAWAVRARVPWQMQGG